MNQSECIRLFSHLINSQNKWMSRITHQECAHGMNWWDPIYHPTSFNLNGKIVLKWGFDSSKISLKIDYSVKYSLLDRMEKCGQQS